MKDYLKVLSDRGYTGGITPEALGNNLPPLRAAGNGKEPCVSARKQLVKLRKPKNRTCLSNQAGPVLLSEACAFSCQISRRRAR